MPGRSRRRRRPSRGVSLLRFRAGSCSTPPALAPVTQERLGELQLGFRFSLPELFKATGPEETDLFSSGWSSCSLLSVRGGV